MSTENTNKRVWLVVEDEKPLRDVLVLTLEEFWAITPLVFTNGAQTMAWLDQVEAGKYDGQLPELALLDIRLPPHNAPQGDEIANRLHSIPATANMVVVVSTGIGSVPEPAHAVCSEGQQAPCTRGSVPLTNQ